MKNLIVIVCIALGLTSFAQSDAKAEALLNEVSTKIKGYKNISLDFKYELLESPIN